MCGYSAGVYRVPLELWSGAAGDWHGGGGTCVFWPAIIYVQRDGGTGIEVSGKPAAG